MVCQKCKSTDATVHTTIIVNGNLTDSHLCAQCSGGAEHGALVMPTEIQGLLQQMLGNTGVHGLGSLLNFPNTPVVPKQLGGILDRACPHCGITIGEIQRTGKLGCPHDYSVFGESLSQVIATSQSGAQHHIGKVPVNATTDVCRAVIQARVDDLQKRLESAVFREDYEQAAKYRDEIKAAQTESG